VRDLSNLLKTTTTTTTTTIMVEALQSSNLFDIPFKAKRQDHEVKVHGDKLFKGIPNTRHRKPLYQTEYDWDEDTSSMYKEMYHNDAEWYGFGG
jgi:hypothetical protein